MENVAIREATANDYDDILKVRTVYGGRDYLKDTFHHILSRHKGFVAVLDAQIIGFKFACIVDGGDTLVTRAGRVSEALEGKGVNRLLDKHILQIYGDHLKNEAMSFNHLNTRMIDKVRSGVLNCTFYRENHVFRTALSQIIYRAETMPYDDAVQVLNGKDLKHIFTSVDLQSHLFPEQLCISHWVPLRIMTENVEHIFHEKGYVTGSNIYTEEHTKALLTIGHSYSCAMGQIYNLDIYGLNPNYLKDHVILQMKNIPSTTKDETLIFEIFLPPPLVPDIRSLMLELGFLSHVLPQSATSLTCVEIKLKGKD